ncbi:hypothetical protein SBOR_4297 [Sclerotinia borealis F-4128]|uniref:Uncharacterized protein n=1 Tax=Sclerotinia borealis (strain F-4128) TaxID=1432307 RepID=W9CF16_SCLBF|nr:hypothetical protein SBOR_4297 [Sclerotinia borealis F-4128]
MAVRTCYQHHDLGFLDQLSHLRNDLTIPGSISPAIFKDRGHYTGSADILLCSDIVQASQRTVDIPYEYVKTPEEKTDKLIYRNFNFVQFVIAIGQETKRWVAGHPLHVVVDLGK